MIARVVILATALALAGCQTTGVGSVKGGECKVFERPEYAVKGLRRYDQDWIDSNVEAGVGGCGWARPKARPASIDGAARKPAGKPAKRLGVFKREKAMDAVETHHDPAIAPAGPVLAKPAPVHVDPVDELLNQRND